MLQVYNLADSLLRARHCEVLGLWWGRGGKMGSGVVEELVELSEGGPERNGSLI